MFQIDIPTEHRQRFIDLLPEHIYLKSFDDIGNEQTRFILSSFLDEEHEQQIFDLGYQLGQIKKNIHTVCSLVLSGCKPLIHSHMNKNFLVIDKADLSQLFERLENIEKSVLHQNQTKQNQAVFTRKQAADFLKCSVSTIDKWKADGILPVHKIKRSVRFFEKDLIEAFNKKKGVAPSNPE